MAVSVSVSVQSNIGPLEGEIAERLMRGENLAAERLLALSAEEVPFELGTLLGSGTVEPATDPETGASVSYNTPYARRLHEHPEYTFQNGRKGKYLEDPALRHQAELGEIIGAEVRR